MLSLSVLDKIKENLYVYDFVILDTIPLIRSPFMIRS